MINVSFEINGRKVRPDRIASEMEKAMLNGIKKDLTQKLRKVRDPITGEHPKVTVRGRSIDKLDVEVEGSERVIKLAKQKLR
ncbi:hypothetical protein V3330_14570 [Wenzhouxiangellaceae bacterium CH-27]|uniref:Trigger factor ribosome-binding bacterial domain-containing protein n=1 Tax=Elongatibacter sediminis TaxID=3119006 RepID=A0AAW9RAS3_9GAMM